MKSKNQQINLSILQEKKVLLALKREDLIHPLISGNKFRKLKYNILEAKKQGYTTLLTYGGAYSNHIAATAYAGKKYGLHTIGVIRGQELQHKWQENKTLKLAASHGMQFHFVTRAAYREKENSEQIHSLNNLFGSFYRLPEGGSNNLAVKGCEEILTESDANFDFICTPVGTGGTIAGLSNAATKHQQVLGFPALKGDFLKEDIRKFTLSENWKLKHDYHFGGYAKVTPALITFMNNFRRETQITLDPIYTAKMLYGILNMVEKNQFSEETKIVAIHTGGLQSIPSLNMKLKKKNLPLIEI